MFGGRSGIAQLISGDVSYGMDGGRITSEDTEKSVKDRLSHLFHFWRPLEQRNQYLKFKILATYLRFKEKVADSRGIVKKNQIWPQN